MIAPITGLFGGVAVACALTMYGARGEDRKHLREFVGR